MNPARKLSLIAATAAVTSGLLACTAPAASAADSSWGCCNQAPVKPHKS